MGKLRWWVLSLVVTLLWACGDSSQPSGSGAGGSTATGSTGTGGSAATGGSTGTGGSTATGGSTGTGGSAAAGKTPTCVLGYTHLQGTLAGESYMGGSSPSNWSPAKITFGVGETDGSSFGNECELAFSQKLTVGAKVPITQGYLYVQGAHPLAEHYVCIQAGEIALIEAPPDSKSVLIEFSLTSGAMGQYCDGAPVDMALYGCISRTSLYVP